MIILGVLISILLLGSVSHAGLIQGQVNQNGTLWIVSYQTPSGNQYPQPFDAIHANNLSLSIYSPLTTVQTAVIHVESKQQGNTTEYENQTFTVLPRTVQTVNLRIPQSGQQQTITITYDNTSVTYFIQTYAPAAFPFGNNPLALLALIGILMLAFTGLNIGLTKAAIARAKYFPPISQRVWIAIVILTGLILYSIYEGYYYDLTGSDWAIWLIPLWFFNFLMILGAWKGKDQKELYLHIRGNQGNDIETGMYVIRTAPLTEHEKGKYAGVNHSGKEYLDDRSYIDFFKRLMGLHVPIIMDSPEQPDNLSNPQVKNTSKHALWKMKDRPSKEHPFSEAYLLDPIGKPPSLSKLDGETITKGNGKTRTRHYLALVSHLNGVHMKEAENFLSGYITASESGKKIHDLNKRLAENESELNVKAYNFQKEIITHTIDRLNMESVFDSPPEIAKQEPPKPAEKKEGEKA